MLGRIKRSTLIIAALVALASIGGEVDVGGVEPLQMPPFGRCMGDCDGDEEVTIGELVRAVRIALGESPRSLCEVAGRGSFGIAALTSAVRNALLGCIAERDLSDFSEFEWQQQSALGFCPELGSLASVRLSRIGDDYRLASSVIVLRDPHPPTCEQPFPLGDCFTAEPQPCRLLTAREIAEVRDGFTGVHVHNGPDAACLEYIFDPCLVKSARWDDESFTDFPCSSGRLVEGETDRVEAVLESLGSGPQVPCP